MSVKQLTKAWAKAWAVVSVDAVWHYAALVAILIVGTALRFNHLDLKALWLDEVITALFSLGHGYGAVPLEQFFSTDTLVRLFTFQAGVSDTQIIERLVTQSTHPPLFFLIMYRWMGWLQPSLDQLAWALRSLPALFGVATIIAIYALNRIAFSPTAGLFGAACMAVSPYAVYLSQEARHYTLPVLVITLSLVGLVQMQQDLQRQRLRLWVWLGWASICAFGLYVHYFFILALVAQVAALLCWMVWQRRQVMRVGWLALGLTLAGVALVTLPWLPVLLGHSDRPETDWLDIRNDLGGYLAPLYQTLVGWVLMVMILPVEAQPLAIAIPCGIVMLLCTGWIARHAWQGICNYWQSVRHRSPLFLIALFTLGILLEFCVIIYVAKKDLTVAPRYNFVYYPGVCALLGAALAGLIERSKVTFGKGAGVGVAGPLAIAPALERWKLDMRRAIAIFRVPTLVLLVGIFSSLLVTCNLAFIKTYDPQPASRLMYQDPTKPLLFVVAYGSLQDIALGLSNALSLHQASLQNATPVPPHYVFLSPSPTPPQQWGKLAELTSPTSTPVNLWLAALPGALSEQFPAAATLKTSDGVLHNCPLDPQRPDRIGFYYRLYPCQSPPPS